MPTSDQGIPSLLGTHPSGGVSRIVTLVGFAAFLLVGRLLIWLAQIAGALRWFWKLHPILGELRDCDLCLGVWVYLFLACVWPMDFGLFRYTPILSQLVVGAISSFAMHLLRLGWNVRFQTILMGDASAVHGESASESPERRA